MDAVVATINQEFVLTFERRFRFPVETVWEAITDPEQVKQWFGYLEYEPTPGGSHVVRFDHVEHVLTGRVITFDPPHVFEHTFGEESNGVVKWVLTPDGQGSHLVLTHTVPKLDPLASFCAGWHTHLAMLSDLLESQPRGFDWDEWNGHFARYSERLAVTQS